MRKPARVRGIGLVRVAALMALLVLIGLILVYFIQHPHRRTSIVIVVLDTVRVDHLSAYGYARETSPRLAALAAEGLRFDQARAVAPWTLPSHASLFTGLRPSQHGCTWEHRWLVDRHDTLAESAARAGLETFGVTTNPNASALYHLDQGFETFLETWRLRERHRGLDDSAIANASIRDWLKRRDDRKPFLLFVNYADAHLPYAPPPPYDRMFGAASPAARELAARGDLLQEVLAGRARVGPEEASGLAALYDGEIRRVDALVGELLDLLAEEDLAGHTLVLVTSDHGELLGEGGAVDHQLSLREELLRVPLLVRWPGQVRPARIPEPVALTAVKGWIDDVVNERLPEWSPPPDRAPRGIVAEYFRPVDLIDFVRRQGLDAAALDRRLACFWCATADGEAMKLLLPKPGAATLWRVPSRGEEEPLDVVAQAPVVESLRRLLEDELLVAPFVETDEDLVLAGTSGDGEAGPANQELAQLGYPGGRPAGVGVHAVEHWSAGVRAREHGELDVALLELRRAAQLAPAEPALRLDLARLADQAGSADTVEALESYLRSLAGTGAVDGEPARWARSRLDALRQGR